MSGFVRWLGEEAYTTIPALIFFGISFNLIHLSSILLMGSERATYTSYLGASIGALLAAKIIVIVRNLPYINLFPNKPLIYNITWKFLVYGIFVFLVQALDIWLHGFHHHKSVLLAFQTLSETLRHNRFWAVQIWVYLLFLFYISLSELGRALGRLQLRKLVFGF